jgi:cyclic pyranopterin phosphate synthase
VKRINVSLDTLDAGCSSSSAAATGSAGAAGHRRGKEAGLQVKLNTVAPQGPQRSRDPVLVEWAHAHGHDLTLIEVMPLGEVEGERSITTCR